MRVLQLGCSGVASPNVESLGSYSVVRGLRVAFLELWSKIAASVILFFIMFQEVHNEIKPCTCMYYTHTHTYIYIYILGIMVLLSGRRGD